MASNWRGNWYAAQPLENSAPNSVLGRTVWSSPVADYCCNNCMFFAKAKARCSELNRDKLEGTSQECEELTFGWCQNLRIWAAMNREKPITTRSYHYCNYHEKEKE